MRVKMMMIMMMIDSDMRINTERGLYDSYDVENGFIVIVVIRTTMELQPSHLCYEISITHTISLPILLFPPYRHCQ